MRTITTLTSIGVCVVAVLTAGGCGDVDESTSTSSQETTATSPAQLGQEQPAPAPTEETPAGDPAGQQWVMPNLVGTVLQDAQDQIQALTGAAVYFTDSHDLTGENRNQVLDANWQVCTQNIEPGAALTSASRIDFGVVKVDEACP